MYRNNTKKKTLIFSNSRHLPAPPRLIDSKIRNLPVFISGNPRNAVAEYFCGETQDSFAGGLAFPQPSSQHYSIVATGGFAWLQFIMKWANSTEFDKINLFIPKAFIIDNSLQVYEFWNLMKELFSCTCNYQEFSQHISNNDNLGQRISRLCYQDANITWKAELTACFDKMFQGLSLQQQDRAFNFIKDCIHNMEIIVHDWLEQDAFEYIKTRLEKLEIEHKNKYQVFIYPTNLIEYMCLQSDHTDQNRSPQTRQQLALENMLSLNPDMVIHTVTSKDIHQRLFPTQFLTIGRVEGYNPTLQEVVEAHLNAYQSICGINLKKMLPATKHKLTNT